MAEKRKSFKLFQPSEKVQLRCGSNITIGYWQGQGRLSFHWFLISKHFIRFKFPGDASVPMFVPTAQCVTTIRIDKVNTEKISHSLWNWVTWRYKRDRSYVYMDMSYRGHHQFACILNLTGRHSLLSKNDLHMNTGGIRMTPTSILATFCSPGVPGGKTGLEWRLSTPGGLEFKCWDPSFKEVRNFYTWLQGTC